MNAGAGGVTSLLLSTGSPLTIANTPGGASTLTTPTNFVTSITGYSPGINVINGTSAAPQIQNSGVLSLRAGTNCSLSVSGTFQDPILNVPTGAGGVTSVTVSGTQASVANTAGGVSAITLPNIVSSVVAGTNINVIGGTGASATIAVTDPLVLASPLTLATIVPTTATQLGYTRSIAWAGGTSGTALGTATKITYATTTITQAGVYLVNCTIQIGISAATTVQSAQLYYEASGVTVGSSGSHYIPFNNAVFSAANLIILPVSVVTIVPVSTTSTLQVSVYGNYTAGTMTRDSSNFLFQITRIA